MEGLIMLQEIVEILIAMVQIAPTFGTLGKIFVLTILPLYEAYSIRYGWVVGVGKYIGQTKGVMFTRNTNACPSGTSKWRYLNADLEWQENGNIYIRCAS